MGKNPVEIFLSTLRDVVPNAIHVYTRGNCFKLYLLLRRVFPQAKPMYSQIAGHVYTDIDGVLYDIAGKMSKRWLEINGYDLIYLPTEPRLFKNAFRWNFKEKPKMMPATVPNIDQVQEAWMIVQQEHLVYHVSQLDDRLYFGNEGESISMDELSARLSAPVNVDRAIDEFSAQAAEITEERRVMPWDDPMPTEMGVGAPRVVGRNPDPQRELTEYEKAVLENDGSRPVFNSCIPSVRWAEEKSMLDYMDIYSRLSPSQVEAENKSQIFAIMMTKIKRALVVDGKLNQLLADKFDAAGYEISYSMRNGSELRISVLRQNAYLTWKV